MFKAKIFILSVLLLLLPLKFVKAQAIDSDGDGLTDDEEINIYHADPHNADTDGDGYSDGEEIKYGFDPNKAGEDKLERFIGVSLKDQTLTYGLGPYALKTILISSGTKYHPTPVGEFAVIAKKPLVTYKGNGYFYPNTRWNMMFKKQSVGNLYIHGAYWHNNFGHPMSHGCINVSYGDMESLYNWTDAGTKVVIE